MPTKQPPLRNAEITDLLNDRNWPHTGDGAKWNVNGDSFRRVCRAVKCLHSLGLAVDEAIEQVREMYWCAYGDIKAMPKPKIEKREGDPGCYYDEYGIMFSVQANKMTAEELKRDYAFHANLYVSDGRVIWLIPHGRSGLGGPLHNFLQQLYMDNKYAFGPTKAWREWPSEKLAEVNAIGIYRLKEK